MRGVEAPRAADAGSAERDRVAPAAPAFDERCGAGLPRRVAHAPAAASSGRRTPRTSPTRRTASRSTPTLVDCRRHPGAEDRPTGSPTNTRRILRFTVGPDGRGARGGRRGRDARRRALARPARPPARHGADGRRPARSVVDSFGRSHDVPNLFIADGSLFVTCGLRQPDLHDHRARAPRRTGDRRARSRPAHGRLNGMSAPTNRSVPPHRRSAAARARRRRAAGAPAHRRRADAGRRPRRAAERDGRLHGRARPRARRPRRRLRGHRRARRDGRRPRRPLTSSPELRRLCVAEPARFQAALRRPRRGLPHAPRRAGADRLSGAGAPPRAVRSGGRGDHGRDPRPRARARQLLHAGARLRPAPRGRWANSRWRSSGQRRTVKWPARRGQVASAGRPSGQRDAAKWPARRGQVASAERPSGQRDAAK